MVYRVVLLRHGQSEWNLQNRFTGWVDIPLTKKGAEESKKAAEIFRRNNYTFDICYTSLLRRAIDTAEIVLREMKLYIPIVKHWGLMERFYGGLTGLNKDAMRKKFGEEQVHIWRRSYDVRPPPISRESGYYPGNMEKYAHLPREVIPVTESLQDNYERTIPYWKGEIEPAIRAGKRVLVCAHGNSIRAIVKYLDNISDDEIPEVEIPIGKPLVYELDENLRAAGHYYLE